MVVDQKCTVSPITSYWWPVRNRGLISFVACAGARICPPCHAYQTNQNCTVLPPLRFGGKMKFFLKSWETSTSIHQKNQIQKVRIILKRTVYCIYILILTPSLRGPQGWPNAKVNLENLKTPTLKYFCLKWVFSNRYITNSEAESKLWSTLLQNPPQILSDHL